MKKFSFYSTAVLVLAIVGVLFISCQKEQNTVTNETNNIPASEAHVKAVAGGGSYAGSISRSYAASLAANYTDKYGNADDQTQSVAFSADDLIAYINGLKVKYKSDIIYVNFGIYGKGADPVDSKDWGRLTVFFTGNKMNPSTSHRTDGVDNTSASDDFLNHGTIYP